MWYDFTLAISEPAVIKRVGMTDLLLDIAGKMEDQISFSDGTYLAMSARYTTDSSYFRLQDFGFPLCLRIRRRKGQGKDAQTISTAEITVWKRDADLHCLVMYGSTNAPEHNIQGDYDETLKMIIERAQKMLS